MMILDDENTDLTVVRAILGDALFRDCTVHTLKSDIPVSNIDDSEDTFKDVILDGTDIFLCLVMSKLGLSKEEVMIRYRSIPTNVKLKIGKILLQTTHNLFHSPNTWG